MLEIERRTLPGESAQDVERELADAARARAGGRSAARDAAAHGPRARAVRGRPVGGHRHALRAAAARTLGAEPEIVGHTAWMDAAFIAAAGIPTVVFGPSGEGAHAVEEYVELESVEQVAEIVSRPPRALLRMSDRDAMVDVAWNPSRDRPGRRGAVWRTGRGRCTTRSTGYCPTPLLGAPRWRPSSGWAPSCSRTRAAASACPRSRPSAPGGRRPGRWPTAWARRPSPPPAALRDHLRGAPLTLVCATEGNHGRAVARARWLRAPGAGRGARRRPRRRRVQAIEAEGAGSSTSTATTTPRSARAASLADDRHARHRRHLWPGYEEIPASRRRGLRDDLRRARRAARRAATVDLVIVPDRRRVAGRRGRSPLPRDARRAPRGSWGSSRSTPPVRSPRPGPDTRSRSAGS